MCRVLGVSRTGFHHWERRAPPDRALTDAFLTDKINRIHDASRGVYGAPRIYAELQNCTAGMAGIRPRWNWWTENGRKPVTGHSRSSRADRGSAGQLAGGPLGPPGAA
jgi:hypothetical protein